MITQHVIFNEPFKLPIHHVRMREKENAFVANTIVEFIENKQKPKQTQTERRFCSFEPRIQGRSVMMDAQ